MAEPQADDVISLKNKVFDLMTFKQLCSFEDLAWKQRADGLIMLDPSSG